MRQHTRRAGSFRADSVACGGGRGGDGARLQLRCGQTELMCGPTATRVLPMVSIGADRDLSFERDRARLHLVQKPVRVLHTVLRLHNVIKACCQFSL